MSAPCVPSVVAAAAAGAAAAAAAFAVESSAVGTSTRCSVKASTSGQVPSPPKPAVPAMPLRNRSRKRSPEAAAQVPNYGFEAALVRSMIEQNLAVYEGLKEKCLHRVLFVIIFEIKLTGLAMVVGPFLLWRAALNLYRGVRFPRRLFRARHDYASS